MNTPNNRRESPEIPFNPGTDIDPGGEYGEDLTVIANASAYKRYLPFNRCVVTNNSSVPLALYLDGRFQTNIYKQVIETPSNALFQHSFKVVNLSGTTTLSAVDLQIHIQKVEA